MALFSARGGCCFSSFVICSGCAWSVLPLVLAEGVFADFVGGSLAEAGHARSKEPEGTRTKEASAGLRHAHAWIEVQSRDLDAESGQAWPSPCPTAVQPFCARSLAFTFRPLGLNGSGEDSDSLDTSSE